MYFLAEIWIGLFNDIKLRRKYNINKTIFYDLYVMKYE